MSEGYTALIVLLCLLQVKHMFADYFLQTRQMLEARDQYLHFGRFLHAGIHAAGSLLVFVLVSAPIGFVIILVLAEGFVHFHIDWWKGRFVTENDLTPEDAGYWRVSGVDQALHQLTYVAMIWIWFMFVIG